MDAKDIDGALWHALTGPEVPHEGRLAVVSGLLEGEPCFVMRARDKRALPALIDYQEHAHPALGPERFEGLKADIMAFGDWQQQHQDVVRDPD